MTGLFFDDALLPQGWARNVRVCIEAARIVSVESANRPAPGDERHRLGLPGIANVHSHAFQRGMAGLGETRGATADNFWTWRELMYRFVERMSPDDVEAIAAQAYVDMLEAGFTRVGEFHYIHHDVSGAPYQATSRVRLLCMLSDHLLSRVPRTLSVKRGPGKSISRCGASHQSNYYGAHERGCAVRRASGALVG